MKKRKTKLFISFFLTFLVLTITVNAVSLREVTTDADLAIASELTSTVASDTIGIQDAEVYYIMNKANGRFMSLDYSVATMNDICTVPRSTIRYLQWTMDLQSNGTYHLKPHSSVTRTSVACVKDNNNVALGKATLGSPVEFVIERAQTSGNQGLYLIKNGNFYVAQDSNYNVYATRTLSSSCYWSFMAVEKEWADIFSFQYKGFNTTANNTLFETVFEAKGYAVDADLVNQDPYFAYAYITEYDDIFVFRGHGGAGILAFYDDDGVSTGALSNNEAVCNRYVVGSDRQYIDSIPENGLSSLRVALYLGCSTGTDITLNGVTYNLLTATYDKGAHFVLGTTQTVTTSASNAFLKGFLEELDQNNSTVLTCVQQGLLSSSGYPITYVGDGLQYMD